ncbi:MAG TPA: hypothetical protein VKQ72_16530, partial [Aggregatilineales bacterium]|nr:hypothetical protein [Aggregatilineales bacterium]
KHVKYPLKSDTPIRIPKAFWWEGPAGGRVLHWLGELYILGNFLGLSSAREFHADKTRYFFEADHSSVDEMYAIAQREVPAYIERLRAGAYPYDAVLIQTAGYNVDNSPPDIRWCELIARWNSDNHTIRLRTATISEWFEKVQSWNTQALPTHRTAWPDHWAHGLGSATARIAQARSTQRRRAAVDRLVEASHSAEARALLDRAFEQELFSLEHTFNAWSTTARPYAAANDFLQTAKELTFHRADLYLEEATGIALRSCVPASPNASRLYIPASKEDGTLRIVHFTAGDLVLSPETQSLVASDGQMYAFQSDMDNSSQFIGVLPTSDDRTHDHANLTSFSLSSTPPYHKARDMHGPGAPHLETAAWQIEVDPLSGGLRSLRDRASDYEWANTEHEYVFGQFVHEAVVHPFGREAVGNLARYVALDMASEEARQAFSDSIVFSRTRLTMQGQAKYVNGSVFDAIEMSGEHEHAGELRLTWRAYHETPVVELVVDWDKRWEKLPEAAYVAFPFRVAEGHLSLETGGGFFNPGSHSAEGQLPGTCATYYTIQEAARISSNYHDIVWSPLDAPLVMTNEINYNRWEATMPRPWNGFIASMPVNHYWHTNFATSQRGFIRIRYRFISLQGHTNVNTANRIAQPVNAYGWH